MTKPPEPGGTPGRPNPSPPGTKLGVLLLRGYLVISMLLLIAKAVQLGRGLVGSDEPIGRAKGGLGSSFGPGGALVPSRRWGHGNPACAPRRVAATRMIPVL